jgi:hypothetical protein
MDFHRTRSKPAEQTGRVGSGLFRLWYCQSVSLRELTWRGEGGVHRECSCREGVHVEGQGAERERAALFSTREIRSCVCDLT